MPPHKGILAACRDKKNQRLMLMLCLGSASILASYLATGSLAGEDGRALLPADYLPRMHEIHIAGTGLDNTLSKDPLTGAWWINQGHHADPYARETLWNTLAEARTQRELSPQERQEILTKVKEHGHRVTVTAEAGARAFEVYGDAPSGVSYVRFSEETRVYVLTLPGYARYVAGIFSLTALQWRDRLFFDYAPGSMKEIILSYPEGPEGLRIVFGKEGPTLLHKQAMSVDPERVRQYVGHFSSFYINEYIRPGQLALYDSILSHHRPFAVLELVDKQGKKRRTDVYANESEPFYLLQGESLSLCEKKRWRRFLAKRKDFAKRAKKLYRSR